MSPADGAEDATHLDIVRAIGRLEGSTTENFKTLFNAQRATDGKVDEVVERLAKLEARPRVRLVRRRAITWKRAGGIAVVIVTILGGLSAAYHEAATLLGAIHHALVQDK